MVPWGLAALAAAGLGAARVDAQSIRLNGPLVQPLGGDVTDYRISPDGAYVVYRADQEHDEVFELFSAPTDGSGPAVRIHEPQSADSIADVVDFAIAGSRVVYLWNESGGALFSAPLTGGAAPTTLSGLQSGEVQSFQVTHDGTQAVFLAGAPEKLFSVPVDGSALPLELDPEDRATGFYGISPDGTFVVFDAGDFGFDSDLLRVPLDASEPPLELAHLGYGGLTANYFADVKLSSDSQHAAFVHRVLDLDRGGINCGLFARFDLHGLALDGSSNVQLLLQQIGCGDDTCPCELPYALAGSRVVYLEPDGQCTTIASDGSGRGLLGANVRTFALSPDESQVVFLSGTPSSSLLQIAPIDGSSVTTLAGPGAIDDPQVSPDSVLVIFIATVPSTAFRGLFAVAATGGAPLLLNGPVVAGGRGVRDFAISPVGGSIVYREERDADEVLELWSVGLDLATRKLSGPLGDFRDVLSFQISADGQRTVYLADQNSDEASELFGTPVAGGALVQYNEPLPGGPVTGDVASFQVTPDGARALYRADEDVDEFIELYSTRSDGHGAPVRLTSPTPDVGDVSPELRLTAAGDWVVGEFVFDSGLFGLFSRRTSGPGPTVNLDASFNGTFFPILFGGFASPPALDPSGTTVCYLRPGYGLRRAHVDGSAPTLDLAVPGAPHRVLRFRRGPDGLRAAYVADTDTLSRFELFGVPTDGSAPAVKLSQPLHADSFVADLAFTPDSSRVLFNGNLEVNSRFELFSVPSDGSSPQVKLNNNISSSGEVSEFRGTPDSSRAVFLASTGSFSGLELYSAPVDGSAPAVRLVDLPFFGEVPEDYVVSADSLSVYFRANPVSATRTGLFRAPIDGSSLAVPLSALPVAGGTVTAFALSPDETRAVYLSDQRIDDVFELFSVSVAGGPVTALTVLPAAADVTSFRIDLESQHVVYLADATADETFELFRTPIAALAPERISRPLGPGGDVQPDFVVQPGGRVLYRADAEGDDVFELFHFLDFEVGEPIAPFAEPQRSRTVTR